MTYVKIFLDCLECIEPLDDAERGRLFTALLEYAKTGENPALQGNERFLFPTLRAQLDRDAASYAGQCETNRRNGAQGGRPPKKPAGFSETEKTQDKEKEEDKEKEKDKDKDSSIGASRPRQTSGLPKREKSISPRGASPAGIKANRRDIDQMRRFLDQLREEKAKLARREAGGAAASAEGM